MSLYRGEKLISEMRVGKTVISDVELQEKSVTPTKSPQVVTPDPTFDGLSKVNVEAVPDNYIDTSDANATSADMLEGSSGYVNGVKVDGSVPRNGAVSKSLNCGESFTIPEGHHNGLGKVTANSLASQTPGNAGAAQIMSGYSAWVNGVEVNGNANKGAEYELISLASSDYDTTRTITTSFSTIGSYYGAVNGSFNSTNMSSDACFIVGMTYGNTYSMSAGDSVWWNIVKNDNHTHTVSGNRITLNSTSSRNYLYFLPMTLVVFGG